MGPRLLFLLALNLPFVVALPSAPLVSEPLGRSLPINAVLFLCPGLPMAALLARRRGAGPSLLVAVVGSLATFAAVLVAIHVLGVTLSADAVWIGIWIVTNAGALLDAATGGSPAWILRSLREERAGWLLFAAAYGAFFVGAVRVVPATGDQDYELQGTVHALLTDLQPRLFTTRGTTHYFAHPPVQHVYVAGSFVGYDRWRDLALYDDPGPRPDIDAQFKHYRANPYRLETRTPNVMLGALTVARLGAWIAAGAAGSAFAWLLALAYVSCPEVFVRSSYAGYFAIGNFALMEMALAEERRARAEPLAKLGCALAGSLAALADHKLMVVVAALAAWEALRAPSGSLVRRLAGALRHPAVRGFAAGTALFWAYGLAVSPRSFWTDHVRHHLVDRVIHRQTWNVEELEAYPSVAALWLEFTRDTGWLLLPLAAASFALLGRRPGAWRGTSGFWLAWALVAAAAFSVVDWRQTKHLVILTLPLFLAPAGAAGRGRAHRLAIAGVVVLVLVWNVGVIARLSADFFAVPKAPEW